MATSTSDTLPGKESNPFTEAELYIKREFNSIIALLTERRDKLLEELFSISLRFFNEAENRRKDASVPEQTVQPPNPKFSPFNLEKLKEQINTFGNVSDVTNLFPSKPDKVRCIGKKGKGKLELNGPRGIASDGKGNLYIADSRNRRIQVFSLDGTYVTEFGKDLGSPHAVVVHNEHVIVTDRATKYAVLKYGTQNYQLVSKYDADLSVPLGLCVDGEEVFVADSKNDRVVVLNLDLEFIRAIGVMMLDKPCDVKVNNNNVFVVNKCRPNVHILTKEGRLIRTIIDLSGDIGSVFLCFDMSNKILISDSSSKVISVFTSDGELVNNIDCDYQPSGIEVTQGNKIICANFSGSNIVLY